MKLRPSKVFYYHHDVLLLIIIAWWSTTVVNCNSKTKSKLQIIIYREYDFEVSDYINYKEFGRIKFKRGYFGWIFFESALKILGRLKNWAKIFFYILSKIDYK